MYTLTYLITIPTPDIFLHYTGTYLLITASVKQTHRKYISKKLDWLVYLVMSHNSHQNTHTYLNTYMLKHATVS